MGERKHHHHRRLLLSVLTMRSQRGELFPAHAFSSDLSLDIGQRQDKVISSFNGTETDPKGG